MRLVSLLASATEMVAALGCRDQLVARSHECDYPPAILSLPVVSRVQIDIDASSARIDEQIKQLAQSPLEQRDAAMKALSIYAIDVAHAAGTPTRRDLYTDAMRGLRRQRARRNASRRAVNRFASAYRLAGPLSPG